MSFHDDDLSRLGSSVEPIFVSRFNSDKSEYPLDGAYRMFFKRVFDVLFTLLASPIILSLVLFSAAVVALDGHNPFYAQSRVGKDGKVFRIYKLRSMVPGADALLRAHLETNAEAREEWLKTQKLRNDPRITGFGRFIRKCSIDELPQFLNVLVGDMSIVGPRPFMVDQRPLYSGQRYFDMRPGLTGLWQISSRNEVEFLARVRFDDLYSRTLSFGSDLRIMAKTVVVMLRGTGC